MNVLPLLLAAFAATNTTIDDFTYADASAAAEVWKAAPGTPPLEPGADGDRKYVKLRAPFASDAKIPRVFVDRAVSLDLRSVGEFTLEMAVDVPEAAGQLSLYFHSGDGWYSAAGRPSEQDWHVVRFPKTSFRPEDTPAGWGKVDGIRFAVWRGQAKDAVLKLGRLAASSHEIALIVPDVAKRDDREVREALDVAERVAGMLADVGLGSDSIDESSLAAGALGNRPLAVLAYNPRLSAESIALLEQYVERGGKLFICYNLPPRLATALGLTRGRYVQQRAGGQFSEIHFDKVRIGGMPEVVKQASWNITDVQPAEPNVHRAMIVGAWHDNQGQPTGHAAMLVSDRGAFFSHIVLADDRQAKREMLAAVMGLLHPPLWKQMAKAANERFDPIGHCPNWPSFRNYIEATKNPRAAARFQEAMRPLLDVGKAMAERDYPRAVTQARAGRKLLVQSYLLAQPSPKVEARAIWNHSGTGIYAGDWERSCKLLADSGLNMVLPNMLWGGLAHYPSDVLPRSSIYEKYGDQIAQCTAAARRHGLEVHVWKVNWNLGAAPRAFKDKMRDAGRLQRGYDADWENWLCPSHPENQKLELESMLEVARKYDVDGLHFDYIRYPGNQECYCDGCRERFEADSGRAVKNWPLECYNGDREEEYRDWRCGQITRLVAAVHREAKKLKPEIKISAAVFGSYPDCRRSVGQDWVAWIKAGYLDFVCPMDYSTNDLYFTALVENQLRLVGGRVPVYPGIGAWRLSPDGTVGQIHHARRLGAPGFTLFDFNPDVARTALPALSQGAASEPATSPHRE